MNTDHEIKKYQDEIEKINTLLDSKRTSDFENEKSALKWYQKLCNERKILSERIKHLEDM